MMPLNYANAGEEMTVKRIGGSPEIRQHIEDLGFHVGSGVTVVNRLGGNVIVKVKDSRIALSEGLAQKIMV